MIVADEGTRLGLHVGHGIVTRWPGHSEPGSALVVGIGLIPAAQEIIGILAAIVPANPDLAARGHGHPRVILILALRVGIDLLGRREGHAAVGGFAEERIAVEPGGTGAAVGALQVAARIDHVDVLRIGRADANDREAARAEAASTGVDAEDAAPGLGAGAGAALHDVQFRDGPGGAAVSRAGHFIAHPGRTADVLVVVLLVADIDPAVGGDPWLAGLLVSRSGDRVADQELRPPGHAAVSGLVARDAPRRLIEVGIGDVDDVRVAGIDGDVRAVGRGDLAGTLPGGAAIGGAEDVGGRRAGVEDDGIHLPIGAIGDAGVAAGGLHAVEGGVARSPGGAAVGGAEDTDAGGLAVVGGADGVQVIERVDVDLEFVLPAAEHVAVAHTHIYSIERGEQAREQIARRLRGFLQTGFIFGGPDVVVLAVVDSQPGIRIGVLALHLRGERLSGSCRTGLPRRFAKRKQDNRDCRK
ncbi:MAG: hypothetical protein DMF00_05110, partial [Verrucomicrobia bacterium]